MTDLERFFHHLVHTLSAVDPARLHQAIPLVEIYGSIVPYRGHRRALRLDTSEDYEAVLMRLCAGEGGYVRLSPEEARQRLERELGSPHPELGVLRQVADAVVSLVPSHVAAALAASRTDDTVSEPPAEPAIERILPAETVPPLDASADLLDALLPTPEPEIEAAPLPAPAVDDTRVPAAEGAVHCLACGEALPGDRRIKFCPYCGEGLVPAHCSACGTAMEPGWRFCAGCGHPAGGRAGGGRRA